MKRDEYLNDKDVKAFIDWTAKLVTGEWRLKHDWTKQNESRQLTTRIDFTYPSLYYAFTNYEWNGKSFKQTEEILNEFRRKIRAAMKSGDRKLFLDTAECVIKWACTNFNIRTELELDALEILKDKTKYLDPDNADTTSLKGFMYMNASYSKIYSVMIDGFPIYDSRVACAFTSLIWLFRKDTGRRQVPDMLRLGVPPNNGKQDRNPYGFPNIHGERKYTAPMHADSNLKAAWILGELAKRAGNRKFGKLKKRKRIRALEAALFMIGDRPLKEDAIRKR